MGIDVNGAGVGRTMGSYWDHKAEAILWFVVLCVLILGSLWYLTRAWGVLRYFLMALLGIPLFLVGYPAIRLGAMFPDIDHPSSIPFRRAMQTLPLLGFVLGAAWHLNDEELDNDAGGMLASGIFGTVFALVFRRFYQKGVLGRQIRPTHRGRTHKPRAGRFVSGWFLRGIWFVTRGLGYSAIGLIVATVFSSFFYLGYLSHLVRDRQPAKRTRPN